MYRNASQAAAILLFVSGALLPSVTIGQPKKMATSTTATFRIQYDRTITASEIARLGKLLDKTYDLYRKKFGASDHRTIDVFALSSGNRVHTESRSKAFDDAVLREGRIYLDARAILRSDTAVHNPAARVVSESVLEALRGCPRWLIEVYGIYAGKEIDRFGSPARLTVSTFSDLTEDYLRAESADDLKEMNAKIAATARFLVDRYGEKKLEDLYSQFKGGKQLEDAFEAAFGEKMPDIEKAWAASLRSPPKG
jgi:hypothetical protein